jgi:hypothetical protein
MVLVLDAVSSSTSTSTAGAEYEYEEMRCANIGRHKANVCWLLERPVAQVEGK